MWPRPAGVVAYRQDQPWGLIEVPGRSGTYPPEMRWRVGADTTEMLVHHAATWGGIPDPEVYLSQSLSSARTSPAALPAELTFAITYSKRCEVTFVHPEPPRSASVAFNHSGEAIYLRADNSVSFDDEIHTLVSAMTLAPELVDIAVVRAAGSPPPSWDSMPDDLRPAMPYATLRMFEWERARHLWGEYVPDAHAIQLLTSAHLERAHDLSAWDVTEVAPNRYLVRAKDLKPWFDRSRRQDWIDYQLPEPGAVAQARADFGAMIMTREVYETNPAPILALDAQ